MSANPITHYGSAPVDSDGILNQFVRLPCDNSPCEQNGVLTYTEKWKGAYSTAKEILSHIATGDNITFVNDVLGANRVKRYTAPSCPSRNNINGTWKISSIQVQELEAGSHAILTLNYNAVYDSSSSGEDISENNVWSISWQSYNVSPWAFCKNEEYDLNNLPWSPSDTPPQEDWSKGANRSYINKATTSPQYTVKGNFLVYTPDNNQQDVRFYLHPANIAIWKKAALDRNAVYHTPVIVHQTSKRYNSLSSTYSEELGGDIDHITELPSGCPYTFPNDTWDWIKIGDDMQQQKSTKFGNTTFTRRETWAGYPHDSIDKNYYGNGTFTHTQEGIQNGRWEINGV